MEWKTECVSLSILASTKKIDYYYSIAVQKLSEEVHLSLYDGAFLLDLATGKLACQSGYCQFQMAFPLADTVVVLKKVKEVVLTLKLSEQGRIQLQVTVGILVAVF